MVEGPAVRVELRETRGWEAEVVDDGLGLRVSVEVGRVDMEMLGVDERVKVAVGVTERGNTELDALMLGDPVEQRVGVRVVIVVEDEEEDKQREEVGEEVEVVEMVEDKDLVEHAVPERETVEVVQPVNDCERVTLGEIVRVGELVVDKEGEMEGVGDLVED